MSAPEPEIVSPGIARWSTPDGLVVADRLPASAGVHFYPRQEDGTLLRDPAALAAALLAAADLVAPRSEPLSREQEIAFRKDWDARVVPSAQPSGERGPGGTTSIIGTRPRKQDTP